MVSKPPKFVGRPLPAGFHVMNKSAPKGSGYSKYAFQADLDFIDCHRLPVNSGNLLPSIRRISSSKLCPTNEGDAATSRG